MCAAIPGAGRAAAAGRGLRRRDRGGGAGAAWLRRAGAGRRRRRRSRRRWRMPRPAARTLALAYRVGVAEDLLAEGAALPGGDRAGGDRARARSGGLPARPWPGCWQPGGLLVLSTLNRTAALVRGGQAGGGIRAALAARGTHDWRRFMTPAELGGLLRDAGLRSDGSDRPGAGPAARRLERAGCRGELPARGGDVAGAAAVTPQTGQGETTFAPTGAAPRVVKLDYGRAAETRAIF